MTPGEAADMNASSALIWPSANFKFSTSVCAARASRTLIGPVQAGGLAGAGAGGRLAPRAAGIAEHAPGHAGEVHQVLVLERLARAPEPMQAVLDIGGVARLTELAVVDDVDAGRDLLAGDLPHPP